MTINKHFYRRLHMWRRAPLFYGAKLRRAIFGVDRSWLVQDRDNFSPGSWQWLASTEQRYGGFKPAVAEGQNIGGDRMSPFFHGYGQTYEEFLRPFMAHRDRRLTLVEVGILNGSGLAIWCDLFPKARVIGLDINLANFEANRPTLEAAGAFTENKPELFQFDQLDEPGAKRVVNEVLGESKVDIAIDDGLHSMESIRITLNAMINHMADRFVYFIEDHFDTYDALASAYPQYRWSQRGEMTVLRR